MSEEKKETIVENEAPEKVEKEGAEKDQEEKSKNPEKIEVQENTDASVEPVKKEEKAQKDVKEEKKPEFVEEVVKLEEIQEETEYPPEEFEFLSQLYNKTLSKVNEGDIVSGKILDVSEKEVIVDIGFKSEGIMPIDEFENNEDINPGDNIEVFLEKLNDCLIHFITSNPN